MFEYKPDFERVLARYEAWWDGQILDRPLTSITFARPAAEQVAEPALPIYDSPRARWLHTEGLVARACVRLANTCYYADALPIVWPNLGPEVFSALYGCELVFGETTSWSVPVLSDWHPDTLDRLRLDLNGFYYTRLVEMTDALLDAGQDRFIVGYTDMHPGGDALAAFRDPQQLCLDMIEHRDDVRRLVDRITTDFLQVYDLFHARLTAAGMPSTTWLPAVCRGRYHVPSNDFSCMISDRAFEDVFLPGIVRECAHMDRCIYHLDGPEALRFLDLLLDIPDIDAIQWVPGAGRDDWRNWVSVYRRIQARGKSFCVALPPSDLDAFIHAFRPEGVWLQVHGVVDRDAAAAVMRRLEAWT